MKYLACVFFFVIIVTDGFAQSINFTLANPQPVIMEVYGGSILSGDLDNDGDIDLVQSGIGVDLMGLGATAHVFLNDGNGNFTIKEQSFNNYFTTEQMVLGDLDNDNDLDIIITAINRSDFYRNNGQGEFIYDDTAPFQASGFGDFIIEDVDGDGDNDVVQFGLENSTTSFALLFINDGVGNFTADQSANFTSFFLPAIESIDLEGDGDIDIISFGENENGEAQVGVYENDGLGSFSVFNTSNIAPHVADEISVGDVDNDGDEDLLITGLNEASKPETILYLNDGNGQFSNSMINSFPDIFASSNALADLDNDNDLDVILIGSMDGGIPNIFSIVFESIGNNNFIASDSLSGEYIAKNTIADFNGDGRKDIIVQGFVDDTNAYWNETFISSVKENADKPVSVFPNPTNGQFQIEWKDGVFNNVEILDQFGTIVRSETINKQGLHSLEFAAPSGIYILKLYGKEKSVSQKILLHNGMN